MHICMYAYVCMYAYTSTTNNGSKKTYIKGILYAEMVLIDYVSGRTPVLGLSLC